MTDQSMSRMMSAQAESACVVFHAVTGEIAHIYHVVTLEGGRHPTKQEIEKSALSRITGSPKLPLDQLQTLHVDPGALNKRGAYAVNVVTRQLIFKGIPADGSPLVGLGRTEV